MDEKYIAIDLKSFYASVECVDRGLDPLRTNLLVADSSRTDKTICLAVSPSLKAIGVPSRPRLFEAVAAVKNYNAKRRQQSPTGRLAGASFNSDDLERNPTLGAEYITALPRMARYIEYSSRIYAVYLKYVAPEDIHVYSIDEVFIYATPYLKLFKMTAHDFTRMLLCDVLRTTGITATAGIGTNMYLCKVAMDIVAKHTKPDSDGVRIAELDEMSYRRTLWDHRPLTDFWRVGNGYAQKLEAKGIYTMGDIARCSLGEPGSPYSEELLYSMFGVNAELLIDHAWGYEPCRISDVKAYKPSSKSLSSGQVLKCPYPYAKAMLVIREMTDTLVLDLVRKGLTTDRMVLTVGYDAENTARYAGKIGKDYYGRSVPSHAHGTVSLQRYTSSTREITEAVMGLAKSILDPTLTVRRINVTAASLHDESKQYFDARSDQIDIFSMNHEEAKSEYSRRIGREKSIQHALIDINRKFGGGAIFKAMSLEEDATGIDRAKQIGGHRA